MSSRQAHLVTFVVCAAFTADVYAQTDTNAVTPGTLRTYSTIYSVGLEWDIANDANHDATVVVNYRVSGTAAWNSALPLLRVDFNGANMLAGSVLFLAPDTDYDVRLALSDPDGGAETRTVVVRTRPVPQSPIGGRVFHVMPGAGGGTGSPVDPFAGIATAQSAAQPGDTFLLHAGDYGGRIRFDQPGGAADYIVWKAAGDGEVSIDGIDVAASHIWFEELTVRDQRYALLSINSPTDVIIIRCQLLNNHYGIFLNGAGTNWYIADNTIVGDTPAASESFDGEAIELNTTSGHTVAHNRITSVADGLSSPYINVDIFGNDIFDTSDDGIEADTGGPNVRMWGNRIHNAVHNGISFQPQSGAPWYIVRNQIVDNEESAFKFRTTDRFVLVHNTIVNWGNAWPGHSLMCCNEGHLLRAIARNNLWVSIQGGQIWGFDADLADWRTDLDDDGFDWGDATDPFAYDGITYSDLSSFSNVSGLELHGIRIRKDTCFEQIEVPGPSPMTVPPQVMTLQAGCEAVDAGAVLPDINDGFVGAAPDMGAYERGQPSPTYGPRQRSDTGAPAITASPDQIDFGSRIVSTTSGAQTVAITNSGTGTLVIRSISIAGEQPGDFSVAATNCPGASVQPSASCSVQATFHPSAEGARSAILSIVSNAPGSPIAIPLSGTGTPQQSAATTIVLWTANVPTANVHGDWQRVADATAAGGIALRSPDAGRAKIAPALASPVNYFEVSFNASAATAYRVWIRLKAQNDSLSNDSVHVQFSDSVTASGSPTLRIGSTSSAEFVLQGGPADTSADHAWGWTDNGWGAAGTPVYFAVTGTHTLRVQEREDGAIVDQIVLSPDTYLSAPPGPRDNDTTVLPASNGGQPPSSTTIVLWTAKVPAADVHGNWQRVSDNTAAGGGALWNPDAGQTKIAPALASPANYFDMTFTANAATAYHVWVRVRAQNDSLANDSIHMQFSDTVTSAGNPTLRIGTTSSAEFVLQGGAADTSANHAWGWTDNGWGSLGPQLYFASTGTHTLRVQQREDGAIIDQIVLSADTYLAAPPGPRDNDTTILPASNGEPPPPSATIVLWSANVSAANVHGNWQRVNDQTAAGGAAMWNTDAGQAKIAPALASPTSYFEITFTAAAATAYHAWIRLKAQNDSLSNDSVHVQFSDAVTSSGSATMRIGTDSSAEFVLQGGAADTSADHAWGWTDNGWGTPGPAIFFATTGVHTLRVQQREDGATVDQIVLSPDTYQSSAPGPRDNDTTILPPSGGSS